MARMCGDCRFSQRLLEGPGDMVACHRLPPTVIRVVSGHIEEHWPRVLKLEWCGEFKPKDER
jgi:hypothetical protein